MQVLRHTAFRDLLLGQAASAVGDRIVFVAPALYVTEIGSPSDDGLVLAAHALPLVVVAFFAAGVGIARFEIWWHTALAERVPPHLLSRVSAYDWMGSLALLPLGYLISGPLGEALGGREVLTVGAAVSIAVLASALLVRETWTLRRLDKSQVAA